MLLEAVAFRYSKELLKPFRFEIGSSMVDPENSEKGDLAYGVLTVISALIKKTFKEINKSQKRRKGEVAP